MVDMDRLGRLVESGVTMVLDATDTFDPTMEIACRALQWWSGELVQVNTYPTTKDTAGFELHWDDHDVLVVQLAGEKSWEVRCASRPAPMFRDAAPNTDPSEEIVWSGSIAVGDVMHIPRGYWHQATRTDRTGDTDAGSGYSLHVTFGFVQRTGVDWLIWLADRSRDNELFRHDLDHDTLGVQAAKLAEGVSVLAAALSPADFLAARRREQRPPRHLSTFSTFGPPEKVVCVAQFRPEVDTAADGSVTVVAAGRRIRFAAKALPALRLLLSGHPVALATVTAETGIDAARIAEMLLRENICAEAGPELSSGYTGLLTTA